MDRSESRQDGAERGFDVACLRAIATDPESRRLALAAAMIKLRALAIARSDPSHRQAALAIVKEAEELHGRLPSRRSLDRLLRATLPPGRTVTEHGLAALADEIWTHFADGRGT